MSKEDIDQQLAQATFHTPLQVDASDAVTNDQLDGSYPETTLMLESSNPRLELATVNVETAIAGSCTKSTPIQSLYNLVTH